MGRRLDLHAVTTPILFLNSSNKCCLCPRFIHKQGVSIRNEFLYGGLTEDLRPMQGMHGEAKLGVSH
jgi:hypothetical protein